MKTRKTTRVKAEKDPARRQRADLAPTLRREASPRPARRAAEDWRGAQPESTQDSWTTTNTNPASARLGCQRKFAPPGTSWPQIVEVDAEGKEEMAHNATA